MACEGGRSKMEAASLIWNCNLCNFGRLRHPIVVYGYFLLLDLFFQIILFNIQIYRRPLWSEIENFGRLTTTHFLGEKVFFDIVVSARLISFFKFGRTTNLLGDTVGGESFWTVFSYCGSFNIFIQLSHINNLKVAWWQAIWRMIQRHCCAYLGHILGISWA